MISKTIGYNGVHDIFRQTQLHPLAMFDSRRVCCCNHGMSDGRKFLASPISPGRVSLLHSPACSEVQQLAGGIAMGFTQGALFWDRFDSKNIKKLMKNDEEMMKTHGHWMVSLDRMKLRLVAQICGQLWRFSALRRMAPGASVSRFRKSDLLQGFKLESGSMWPRGYEQPQSVTVQCNTNNIMYHAWSVFAEVDCPPLSRGQASNDS